MTCARIDMSRHPKRPPSWLAMRLARRRLARLAGAWGTIAVTGGTPSRAMSPPAPEPVDEVLSVNVTRPPEHPGAYMIVARSRARLDGPPSNMVLREVELRPSDPKVMRLWLGASPPHQGTPRDPPPYDIEGRWLHLYPTPQLETVIVEGKSQRVAAKVPR
jgi:hypothetical protein